MAEEEQTEQATEDLEEQDVPEPLVELYATSSEINRKQQQDILEAAQELKSEIPIEDIVAELLSADPESIETIAADLQEELQQRLAEKAKDVAAQYGPKGREYYQAKRQATEDLQQKADEIEPEG